MCASAKPCHQYVTQRLTECCILPPFACCAPHPTLLAHCSSNLQDLAYNRIQVGSQVDWAQVSRSRLPSATDPAEFTYFVQQKGAGVYSNATITSISAAVVPPGNALDLMIAALKGGQPRQDRVALAAEGFAVLPCEVGFNCRKRNKGR